MSKETNSVSTRPSHAACDTSEPLGSVPQHHRTVESLRMEKISKLIKSKTVTPTPPSAGTPRTPAPGRHLCSKRTGRARTARTKTERRFSASQRTRREGGNPASPTPTGSGCVNDGLIELQLPSASGDSDGAAVGRAEEHRRSSASTTQIGGQARAVSGVTAAVPPAKGKPFAFT